MKLFPKLALTVSALLIGSSVCSSFLFYVAERRSTRLQADEERHVLLQNLVHIAQESFLTKDDLLLIKYTDTLHKWSPSLLSASVVSTQGEVLAHSDPSEIGKSASNPLPLNNPAEVLVLTQPVHLGDRWVATVSASFSEKRFQETVEHRLKSLRRRWELNMLGGVAAGIFISFLLALSWTRPIKSLAQAARRVGQKKYDLELDETNRRRDELGFLSRCFQAMARELKELDLMKDDFVSAVTHELRSPLGAIESYLNVIKQKGRGGLTDATWDSYVERMRANTQRLNRFVDDLLSTAALERGTVTVALQPVDMEVLISDVVAAFSAKLDERKLHCSTTFPKEPVPKAWADPEKIRQVVINLLSNAIKFTPEQGKIDICLQAIASENCLRVEVKDTGVGITEADQAKIFNKFEQVKSARETASGPKGTGLGLAICRALIELHSGTLGVESRLGEGSSFYFTLPIAVQGQGPNLQRVRQGELV